MHETCNRTVLLLAPESEMEELHTMLGSSYPAAQPTRLLDGAGRPFPTIELLTARSPTEAAALLAGRQRGGQPPALAIVAFDARANDPGAASAPATQARLAALDQLQRQETQLLFLILASSPLLATVDALFDERPDRWDFLRRPCSAAELQLKVKGLLASWNRRREAERIQEALLGFLASLPAAKRGVDETPRLTLKAVADGVAHQINNPMAYLQSNLRSLARYVEKINTYAAHLVSGEALLARSEDPEVRRFLARTRELREQLKLDFVLADLGVLIQQSLRGMARMQGVVRRLRRISRPVVMAAVAGRASPGD